MNQVINEYTEHLESQMIDLDDGQTSSASTFQATSAKKETPLNGLAKDQKKSQSNGLKENWHYLLLGGLALFVILVLVNPFKGGPASRDKNTFEVIDVLEEQSPDDPPSDIAEKTTVLSQIILTQKEAIVALEKANAELKAAITLNKQDIEALKKHYHSLKSASPSSENTPTTVPIASTNTIHAPNNVLLTNMKINNLDQNIAWVNFKGQVYALQIGDKLNNATVIAIDPLQRVVITDKGWIK